MRIGLVGCVKSKAGVPSAAQDLYVSILFRGRRAYVERTCDRWFIMSAKYGLTLPQRIVAPYDVTLKTASRAQRREWSEKVVVSLQETIGSVKGHVFEVHAGAEYRDFGLVQGLEVLGAQVENPVGNRGLGQQLAFYAAANDLSIGGSH